VLKRMALKRVLDVGLGMENAMKKRSIRISTKTTYCPLRNIAKLVERCLFTKMHRALSSGIVLAIAQNVRNVLSCHQRVISRLGICALALLWIGAPLFAQTSPLPMLQFERRGDDSQATFLAQPFAIYNLMASSSPAGPWTPVTNLPSGLVNPVFGSG